MAKNLSAGPETGVFQQNKLLAAVGRIAAILPNDLAPTNMNGPNRTLAVPYNAAAQLSHCGHSCMAQHFCRLKRRCADQAAN